MSTLRIKILEDGLKPLYEKRVNVEGDAGVDLYFPKEVNIPAKSLGLIVSLGIKGEMVQSVSNHLTLRQRGRFCQTAEDIEAWPFGLTPHVISCYHRQIIVPVFGSQLK